MCLDACLFFIFAENLDFTDSNELCAEIIEYQYDKTVKKKQNFIKKILIFRFVLKKLFIGCRFVKCSALKRGIYEK